MTEDPGGTPGTRMRDDGARGLEGPAEEKRKLRAAMRAARDACTAEWRQDASVRIAERLDARPDFARARRVALFASIGSEVDTGPADRAARARGMETCYPRVGPEGLEFRVCAREALVPVGRMRIPEPPPSAPAAPLDSIDFFVVPGLAFDAHRHRLGYGAGYYDRALAGVPASVPRVGIGFDQQLVESLPHEGHDVMLDAVITEARTF